MPDLLICIYGNAVRTAQTERDGMAKLTLFGGVFEKGKLAEPALTDRAVLGRRGHGRPDR